MKTFPMFYSEKDVFAWFHQRLKVLLKSVLITIAL